MCAMFGDARSLFRSSRRPTWFTPEPGMQTGEVNGDVIGHVVIAPQGFIAFDADASPLGHFDTLRAARRSAATAALRPQSTSNDRL